MDPRLLHPPLINICLPLYVSAPQLIRDDAPAFQGRLVIKTSEDPARWLLTFCGESWKDEEFSEEAFGSILGKADEGEGSPTGPDTPAPAAVNKNNNKNNKNRNKPSGESKSGGTSGGSSVEELSANSHSLQKKDVSLSHEQVNPTDTDASSPNKQETPATNNKKRSLRSRVSDREQRSRRRQALIVDEPEVGSSTDGKRPRPLEPVTRVTKKSKSGVSEDVIKIPMLTGTLFLYRGLRRRAEFIRKY